MHAFGDLSKKWEIVHGARKVCVPFAGGEAEKKPETCALFRSLGDGLPIPRVTLSIQADARIHPEVEKSLVRWMQDRHGRQNQV
ncbi:MAG: hypothetical protein ACRD2D_08230, partial [Terriglobales bacterium]